MYCYTPIDQSIVDQRVAQFRDQTRRYLAGSLSEDEFRPLRLQNGLYLQRHAPMLRVAIPYGMLSSRQLRRLAGIARRYDRGYGHFSTRQNIQFNWPRLEQVPDILAELAGVQMHAIQTSGNCIRNVTTDHLAGIAPDEVVDPLVWCELLRQWSTLHPEFVHLPRKFKIAVSGSPVDRAATRIHDIGICAERDARGEPAFRVFVGGGLGRTPMIGHQLHDLVPWPDLLTYLEAVLRVYNLHGRRDHPYRSRIKILVKDMTPAAFADAVAAEWAVGRGGPATLDPADVAAVAARFTRVAYAPSAGNDPAVRARCADSRAFAAWHRRNVHPHRVPGYAAVTISLKRPGVPPGDATADEMEALADLADRHANGELRVTHEQNLLLADVREGELPVLWEALRALGMARANVGLLTDIIACPGGDYCSLANARSLPVAEAILQRFDDLDHLFDIGELDLNISGCMNSCAHQHVGHIGVLGVDKQGEEFYQVSIGGNQGADCALGKVIGPAFSREEIAGAIERLIDCYVRLRDHAEERFVDVVARTGIRPFKEHVYGKAPHGDRPAGGSRLATA